MDEINAMDAWDYLTKAYRMELQINSKIEQVDALNTLAKKVTTTISDMPRSGKRPRSKMEEILVKIIDLSAEINEDIDNMVDTKMKIMAIIKRVENNDYRVLLEKRFLCFQSWERIAVDMNYTIQHIHRLKRRAMAEADKKLKDVTN